jgi:hypothetical protein
LGVIGFSGTANLTVKDNIGLLWSVF